VNACERIDAHIAALPGWRGDSLARLRRWIRDADPELVEDWKRNTTVRSRAIDLHEARRSSPSRREDR
jgi:hypothetical protein